MLAYLDTFSGLVPCTVLSVRHTPNCVGRAEFTIEVRLNATRGAYKRGEVIHDETPLHVFPRSHVIGLHRRGGSRTRLLGGYDWRAHVDWLALARRRTRHPLPRVLRDSVDWLRGAAA